MSTHPLNMSGKTFCLLTGASRGLGKCLAQKLAALLRPQSTIVLVSRSEDTLRLVQHDLGSEVNSTLCPCDLSDANSYGTTLPQFLASVDLSSFESFLLVHNAGSLGRIDLTSHDLTDPEELRQHSELNYVSTVFLTSHFVQTVHKFKSTSTPIHIVNITSLCGQVPFRSFAQYCSMKAARDMYFKVLSKECPHFRILTYSPGPLDTNMMGDIRANCGDEAVKQNIVSNIVPMEDSVERLLDLLSNNTYKNAKPADFFDSQRETQSKLT